MAHTSIKRVGRSAEPEAGRSVPVRPPGAGGAPPGHPFETPEARPETGPRCGPGRSRRGGVGPPPDMPTAEMLWWGGAEGAPGDEGWLESVSPSTGVDLSDLQGLPPGQAREDGGQALGQHGFAGARAAPPLKCCGCRRRRSPGRASPGPAPSPGRNRGRASGPSCPPSGGGPDGLPLR